MPCAMSLLACCCLGLLQLDDAPNADRSILTGRSVWCLVNSFNGYVTESSWSRRDNLPKLSGSSDTRIAIANVVGV